MKIRGFNRALAIYSCWGRAPAIQSPLKSSDSSHRLGTSHSGYSFCALFAPTCVDHLLWHVKRHFHLRGDKRDLTDLLLPPCQPRGGGTTLSVVPSTVRHYPAKEGADLGKVPLGQKPYISPSCSQCLERGPGCPSLLTQRALSRLKISK